jgi:hypothetical protein
MLFVFGTYLAEGWKFKDGSGFGIMLGLHDVDKKDRLMKILGDKAKVYKRRTGWQIMCYDKDYLKKVSWFGSNSFDKRIGDIIFSLDVEQQQRFFRYYFECDGNLVKPNRIRNGYTINLSTISKKLASDLVFMFSLWGVHATVKEEKRDIMDIEGRRVNCHNIFRVKISGNYNFEKIRYFPEIKVVSKTKRSPKRALGYLKDDKYMFVPIKSIEEVTTSNLYDIEVEGTNLILTSFNIVVHNCGFQYAEATPSRGESDAMRMCYYKDFAEMLNSNKPFDGSVCVKCYYDNYNDILDKLLDTDVKHEEFI